MSKGIVQFTERSYSREAFAGRLRLLTSARGAIPKLSRDIGASVQAIRKWAAGETEPSRDFLVAMAESLKVSLDWLATGRGDPKGNTQQVDSNGELPARWVLDALEGLEEWLNVNAKSIHDPKAKRDLVLALAQEAWEKEKSVSSAPPTSEASDIIDLTKHERFLKIIAK